MIDVLITMLYNYISKKLFDNKHIETIPTLEITNAKTYMGKIDRNRTSQKYLKVKISRLHCDEENHIEIINTICHEFAHMEYWEHGEEHTKLINNYMLIISESLNIRKDQKPDEKEIVLMQNINKKQLIKKLNESIDKNYVIDLKLDDKQLIDLVPFGFNDTLILKCKGNNDINLDIYISRIKAISIYKQKENFRYELIYNADVTQDISTMTKKELEHELIFLRNVVKFQQLEISKLIHSSTTNTKNPRGGGRKPYNNEKVIELIKEIRLEGNGYKEIANRLNSMNVLTDKGKPWGASSIKCIIKRYIEN